MVVDGYLLASALAVVISLVSLGLYIQDTVQAKATKPNGISFLIWTLINAVAFAAQWSGGEAENSIILVGLLVFESGVVMVLAFTRFGYRKYEWWHFACLGVAAIAMYVWWETDEPMLALGLIILADLVAYLPTLAKIRTNPETEHWPSWLLLVIAEIFGVLSVNMTDDLATGNYEHLFLNLAFPFYLVIMNTIVTASAWKGQRKAK